MSKLTPMMAQYKEIKAKHQDCILMFRLGDFYEMFFEDAQEASKLLQITLTGRGKNTDTRTPMCGIPYHAVDQYLYKLTRAGKKVAICDQMTAPDGKGIVERSVVRIVTPGTTFDEHIIEGKSNNYVSCVVGGKHGFAFAYADVTTGEFRVSEFVSSGDLLAEIGRLMPSECVCREELRGIFAEMRDVHVFTYQCCGDSVDVIKKHLGATSLKGFGLDGKVLACEAAATLLEYLRETQKTDLGHIRNICYYDFSQFMPLDETCIRNLGIFSANKDACLIGVLDQTMTAMGGRLLRKWLLHPLLKREGIEARISNVAVFVENSSLQRGVREKLDGMYDIERLLSRLSLGTGNARDLVAMKQSLWLVPELRNLIVENLPQLAEALEALPELCELIERAIRDETPLSVREGGMIKPGFNAELDDLLSISTEGKSFIMDLQKREAERTGIASLKVKFNKIFGYYIEISNANLRSVPEDYFRKQTLVNAERFITPELKAYEDKVLNAEARIKELEYELFYGVRMEIVKEIVKIQKIAEAVAELDVLSNLAFVAVRNHYCRPVIVESGLEIVNGRHPVVERVSGDFVPNDCRFDDERRFLLITGPNMGGKSTYLRQVALIVLMAQIGSYVPADSVRMGIFDRIFTRVGASDNLVKGESTFMVEMTEAAYILNNATERSLVILDEVGRGTSTYDGVSIAWAMSEFIHDKLKAYTLFATHYHELIELADGLEWACNLCVAVRENEKEGVVFLYKVVEGGVDKSYGIEVAKLAGLPVDVVSRARGVLSELENKHIKKSKVNPDQIGLFAEERAHAGMKEAKLLKELEAMDLEKMTPLEAMQKLDSLKRGGSLGNSENTAARS